MYWFILILACIILWGVTDILYKASFYKSDALACYKSFVWVGLVMALAGIIMSNWSDTLLDSVKLLKGDVIYLIPLCIIYAIAWLFGILGNKHLEASVVSTIENIDGALVTIIVYYYFLLTGYIHPSYTIGAIIYGLKPKALKFKNLGFHEIFHIFILIGSLCHYIAVFKYVI